MGKSTDVVWRIVNRLLRELTSLPVNSVTALYPGENVVIYFADNREPGHKRIINTYQWRLEELDHVVPMKVITVPNSVLKSYAENNWRVVSLSMVHRACVAAKLPTGV